MPSFDLEFEVYCASCGDGICNNCNTTRTYNRQANRLEVEPCQRCLDNAREEGENAKEREVRDELGTEIEELQERIQELTKALSAYDT